MPRYWYRLRYRHAAWRGKPDPSGFGVGYWVSNDLPWLEEKATAIQSRGAFALSITDLGGA